MKITRNVKVKIIQISAQDFVFLKSINSVSTLPDLITKNKKSYLQYHTQDKNNWNKINDLVLTDRSGSSILKSAVPIEDIFEPTKVNTYMPRRLIISCETAEVRSAICATLHEYVAAEKGLFQEFNFIFHIRLNDVQVSIEKTVAEKFNSSLLTKTGDVESVLSFLDRMGMPVLLLLDAFDGISEEGVNSLQRIISFKKCLPRAYLRRATIVFTSSKNVPENISQYFERFLTTRV